MIFPQAVISAYETDAIAGFHQDKKIELLYSVIQELAMFTVLRRTGQR